jgi:hypothetical protein
MSTPSNREQFVKQLEAIVDGINKNLTKVNYMSLYYKMKIFLIWGNFFEDRSQKSGLENHMRQA